MSPLISLYASIRPLLIFSILILILTSIFACSEKKDDIIGPNNSKTAPAKVGMILNSDLSINEITAIRLTVTGDDMQKIELDLQIDRENNKATGAVNIPVGDNRLFRVEVYACYDPYSTKFFGAPVSTPVFELSECGS